MSVLIIEVRITEDALYMDTCISLVCTSVCSCLFLQFLMVLEGSLAHSVTARTLLLVADDHQRVTTPHLQCNLCELNSTYGIRFSYGNVTLQAHKPCLY